MEDKQRMFDKLVEALQCTRAAGMSNNPVAKIVVYIENGDEWAHVIFKEDINVPLKNQYKGNRFCITADSGIACIYDFVNWARNIW